MNAYFINPLTDPRWNPLVTQHPRAGVFHTIEWLSALHRTYGYEPLAITTCAPQQELTDAALFCRVQSWMTGRRLVSLPFSDHCDLLVDSPAEQKILLDTARQWMQENRYRHAEIRPRVTDCSTEASDTFCFHVLPLDAPADELLRRTHKDCIQRKVRRAEKEALQYTEGNSEALLQQFYQLLIRTRRRHCLPPQPYAWFRNLAQCMGPRLSIHLASQGERPLAALLTLSCKQTITYKYGCSDERFNNLGGTPFLFWKVIGEAKAAGMTELDLGRSELDNPGLIAFKDRLGATRTDLHYYRLSTSERKAGHRRQRGAGLAKWVFQHLPDALLVASGRLLYRHIA